MALKFDKQYRVLNKIDSSLEIQLFNIINSMDTQELLNFSMINKIPLGIVSNNGNNLIHSVLNNDTKQFIKTEDYFKAELSDKKIEWFSCLITSDHKIQIGNETFWDWEDHFVKKL